MRRVSFDAVEPNDKITPEALQRASGEITFVHRPSTDGGKTIRDLRV